MGADRRTLVLALATILAGGATAVAATSLPQPPRAAWTLAGTTVLTRASTFCWSEPGPGAYSGVGLCADGTAPSCADPRTITPRVSAPAGRTLTARVTLGFRPKSAQVTFTTRSGRSRSIRLAPRRGLKFRVSRGFRGAISLFAVSRTKLPGGDAVYGICLTRR